MRLDKLLAMEVFARVVESGSFTRAAASLRLPKATASTLLQQLEADLGVRLLHRTTRRTSVTTEGAAYLEHCRAILDQVAEADDALAHRHAAPRGRLRVQAATLMARLVIVPGLASFFARFPDIEIDLQCSEQRAELVEDGIDCAVWSGELEDSSLIARPVGQLFLTTCAAPSYLAERGRPLHPQDLVRHRCLARITRGGGRQAWIFARDKERITVTPADSIGFDDENAYLAAVEAGLGLAQIPAFVGKDGVNRGRLDIVLEHWNAEPLPIHVVYPQRRHLSAKVRAFVDWIVAFLGANDDIQLRSALPRRIG